MGVKCNCTVGRQKEKRIRNQNLRGGRIGREEKHVCPAWREIEAAAATSILDTTVYMSSQVGSIVCCAVTRDVTQSNGLQEGSFIFLFSVSCFDEEVIFFTF